MRVKRHFILHGVQAAQLQYDEKARRTTPDRLEMNKYCRFCKKHTLHREPNKSGGKMNG